MSFQWTVVAMFLYAEIFLCFLLCLPFIAAKRWQFIFKSRLFGLLVSYGNLTFLVLISVLCLLFADAVREVRKYSIADEEQLKLSNNPNSQNHVMMMLFRAQRNLYISGFALFLGLVLRRLALLISETAVLEVQCQGLQRQAESASRAAEGLMDQSNEGGDADAPAEMKITKEEIEKLKSELTEARNDAKTAAADTAAMKSQAEATNKEYDRLMAEVASLQAEIGETSKKDD